MKKEKTLVGIFTLVEDSVYKIGTISFNYSPNELFYSPIDASSKKKPLNIYPYSEQQPPNPSQAGGIEHISFHADGTVHIRLKKLGGKVKKQYKQVTKLETNIFENILENRVSLLFAHTIYFASCAYPVPYATNNVSVDNENQFIDNNSDQIKGYGWDINGKHDITIIGILHHPSLPKQTILGTPLARILSKGVANNLITLPIFENLDVSLLLSKMTLRPPAYAIKELTKRPGFLPLMGLHPLPDWNFINQLDYINYSLK